MEQELGDKVGNGSIAIVKLFVFPYYMATTKTVGLSMRMNAVQIIDLKEYQASEFGDESGVQAEGDDDEF